jgi:uncharacterized membrane protein
MDEDMKQSEFSPGVNRLRTGLRWLAAIFFIAGGIGHFVRPEFYQQLVPPGFPSPKVLVIVSGIAEIAGGLGLLIPRLRRAAGWGLVALLIAVFPANIYMVAHPERFGITPWLLWARLPLQGIFIAWVWFVAIQRPRSKRIISGAQP